MATIVSEMTVNELRNLIGDVVEEKLSAMFVDEDNAEFTDELRQLLARQDKKIEAGERGEPLEQIIARLGLES